MYSVQCKSIDGQSVDYMQTALINKKILENTFSFEEKNNELSALVVLYCNFLIFSFVVFIVEAKSVHLFKFACI